MVSRVSRKVRKSMKSRKTLAFEACTAKNVSTIVKVVRALIL